MLQVGVTAVTPLGLADFLEAQPACQVVWDGVDHRAVAEWLWSVGCKVQVACRGAEWFSRVGPAQRRPTNTEDGTDQPDAGGPALEASLSHPTNPVLLTGVDLSGLDTLKDADLSGLADCTTLRDLQLHNSSLTGACLTHLPGSRSRETSDAQPSTPNSSSRSRETSEIAPSTSELSRVRLQGVPLQRLRSLSLAGLPIEDQDLAQLAELKQLQHLELHGTKITDAWLQSLVGLTELEILILNDTAITTTGLESLKQLPKLISLNLQYTSADDRTAELLCEFPNLRTVDLKNTRLTEAGVKRLAQRPLPWHRLHLANLPTVTDAILTDLRGQRELVTLDLSQTSVTSVAFGAFLRHHPLLGMTLPTEESEAPDLRVARRVLADGSRGFQHTVGEPNKRLRRVATIEPWSHDRQSCGQCGCRTWFAPTQGRMALT